MKFTYATISAVALLAGCTTPYVPPATNAATLRFESDQLSAFLLFPDGERCGTSYKIPPELNPLKREDRSIRIPAGNSTAVWLHYQRYQPLKLCSIYLSFTPAPNGVYAVTGDADDSQCHANIRAVPDTGTPKPTVRQMKSSIVSPDMCVPMN